MVLTEQQEKFIGYLRNLPAAERAKATTAAALFAGYSLRTARVQGSRLYRHPKVVEVLGGEQATAIKALTTLGKKAVTTSGKEIVTQPVTNTTTAPTGSGGRMFGVCQLPGWEEEEKKERDSGRPTGFSTELAEEICYSIATSAKGLKSICDAQDTFPSHRTVLRWLTQHDDFCHMYSRAREMQGDFLAFQGLEIADDDSLDFAFKEDAKGEMQQFLDREAIARSKLKVDHRKWLAGKLAPRKYGDKIEPDGGGSVNPLAQLVAEVMDNPVPTINLSKRYKVIEINPKESE